MILFRFHLLLDSYSPIWSTYRWSTDYDVETIYYSTGRFLFWYNWSNFYIALYEMITTGTLTQLPPVPQWHVSENRHLSNPVTEHIFMITLTPLEEHMDSFGADVGGVSSIQVLHGVEPTRSRLGPVLDNNYKNSSGVDEPHGVVLTLTTFDNRESGFGRSWNLYQLGLLFRWLV